MSGTSTPSNVRGHQPGRLGGRLVQELCSRCSFPVHLTHAKLKSTGLHRTKYTRIRTSVHKQKGNPVTPTWTVHLSTSWLWCFLVYSCAGSSVRTLGKGTEPPCILPYTGIWIYNYLPITTEMKNGPAHGLVVKALDPTRPTMQFQSWTLCLEEHAGDSVCPVPMDPPTHTLPLSLASAVPASKILKKKNIFMSHF